ncbi:selenophosphate synthase [Rhizobium sp. SG_E_25_P2]|jgi:selenophosphate synthase|uniref:hypothetical protein n=1 Tax=Rhizobium sp. SG_E_25_P2 TaxID=2879942 RepID=UPI002473E0DA|nr:hypothetical protein [Rhizobium sp. SG_E_25_P2]MDH6269617.1 selenophosphate synthase [Rhizobium sp. SG_E_25_P2]
MTKTEKQSVVKAKTGSKSRRVVVTLPDGVEVLRPAVKPTHFTEREIRKTIEKVLRENSESTANLLRQV